MRTFREYSSERLGLDNNLNKLIGLLWERYKPELRDFLDRMSAKDANIRQIVMDLQNEKEPEENDQIYKTSADDNHGNSSGDIGNGEN